MEQDIQKLRYPIGKFEVKEFSAENKREMILALKTLPDRLEQSVLNLDEAQLQTPYRDGGWTVQQVVHHLHDSHINAYCRFKLGLTEKEMPTVKAYDENVWADTPENKTTPINLSITLLHALHARLVDLLEQVSDEDYTTKMIFHPVRNKNMNLWELISLYAWHGKHHVAHITELRNRMGWK